MIQGKNILHFWIEIWKSQWQISRNNCSFVAFPPHEIAKCESKTFKPTKIYEVNVFTLHCYGLWLPFPPWNSNVQSSKISSWFPRHSAILPSFKSRPILKISAKIIQNTPVLPKSLTYIRPSFCHPRHSLMSYTHSVQKYLQN